MGEKFDGFLRGVAIVGVAVVGAFALGTMFSGAERAAAPARQTVAAVQRDTVTGRLDGGAVADFTATRPAHEKPQQLFLTRAHSAVFNVKKLKSVVVKKERSEHEYPPESDTFDDLSTGMPSKLAQKQMVKKTATAASMPSIDSSFDGLDYNNWGGGHPPDENGDVGPTYFVQTVNTSIGIYDKSTGNRVAAFTFNAFMSQGQFGNLCDTNNFGDPIVLYDSYENRWFITDFAFTLDGSGNVSPQTVYQCFAVSKTGDPVNGGWNYYSIQDPGGLGDYPKFGIWPDGIYMSANMFDYSAAGGYQGYHVWALDKQQMYAGAPQVSVVDFAGDTSDFTVIPVNSKLAAGAPPVGSPEYFVSTWDLLNGIQIYKFHVDWDKISTSTFTGPFTELAPNCWPNAGVADASTPANPADTLEIRTMAAPQYTNQGGVESLWIAHTVQRGVSVNNTNCNATTGGNATIRWYQANVTGGTVAANLTQGSSFDPDGANTNFRFQPALAVDRVGDMAVTYTKSNATTDPKVMYDGRVPSDPANTLETESTLMSGTGAQSGNCGGAACIRWGDYAGMELDPNGCEFWMVGEYFAATGLDDLTRIGSFHYPGCTPVGNGTLSGTVTDGTNPIAGATVTFGSRTTTTDANGAYSFTVAAGTYPAMTVDQPGYTEGSASSLAVPNGSTLTQNFTLTAAAQTGCITDNSQTLFQRGAPAVGCDLTSSPGAVTLSNPSSVDQQDSAANPVGIGTTTNTSWSAQTFTAARTGQLTSVDFQMYCNLCTANPNLVVSIRATSSGLPTGSDLVSTTIAGDSSGNEDTFTATFGTPLAITSGTKYALVVRTATSPGTGAQVGYVSVASTPSTYAGGSRITSVNSGSTWTADTAYDLNFHTYVRTGYVSSTTFVSSLRDANPAAGNTPHWTTLSWTASTPASTSVKFQVAGSNSIYGPWNYVGPDGTASTFFTTTGADLSQFNGDRYLEYEAFLATTSSAVTPSLSSVSTCYQDVAPALATTLAPSAATGKYGGTTTISATLTAGGNGVAGRSVEFSINGSDVGGASTNASGVATVTGVSLAGIGAGSYPTGITAAYAGDGSYQTSNGSNSLTVAKADQAIAITAHAPTNASNGNQFTVAATGGGSGNSIVYGSSGACTNTGANFTMTGSGQCVVTYDQAGGTNYNTAPELTDTVNSTKANQTIQITTDAPATAAYGAGFTVAATGGGSENPVTYGSSGACTNSGAHFTMTSATGTCTVTYDQAGDATHDAAQQLTESVTAQKADQTIDVTMAAPSTAAYTSSFTVAANAPGSSPIVFGSTGSCTNVGGQFTMTSGTGTCTVLVDSAADANYTAAPEVNEGVTATKLSQSITFATPATHTYGDPDLDPGATSSSGYAVSYGASGACSIVGGIVHFTGAGSCTTTANQAGDTDYGAAPQIQHTFTVDKAALSITPDYRQKLAGQALTLGTSAFTTSGLVGSDAVSGVTLTSSGAAAGAASGDYSIFPSLAVNGPNTDLADNYAITYNSGTLYVIPVEIVALNGVTVKTTGGKIDSYDSSLGAYGSANRGSSALAISNGPLSFAGVILSGSATSTLGAVTVAKTAKVSGDVLAGTTASILGTVGGTVTQNAPSGALSGPTVSACSPFSAKTGISGGKFAYSATTGNLTVKSGTVKLANGTYCFHNVALAMGATLAVNGTVTINLTGRITGATGHIANKTNLPANLHIDTSFVGSSGLVIAGGSHAYMTIVAPGAGVSIPSGTFFGTVLAATVSITGSKTAFHADTD